MLPELREFRRQHDLSPDDDADGTTEVNLRDEIEAEIEAAARRGKKPCKKAEESLGSTNCQQPSARRPWVRPTAKTTMIPKESLIPA